MARLRDAELPSPAGFDEVQLASSKLSRRGQVAACSLGATVCGDSAGAQCGDPQHGLGLLWHGFTVGFLSGPSLADESCKPRVQRDYMQRASESSGQGISMAASSGHVPGF